MPDFIDNRRSFLSNTHMAHRKETMMKIGQRLSNGGLVIAVRDDVVLANWNGQYVTWRFDDNGDCYWGRYHGEDFQSASDDFKARASNYELFPAS